MPVEELRVYVLGGRRVVYVLAGRGEQLRDHLATRGFFAVVSTAGEFDRLELARHADIEGAQAALNDWPR